MNRTFFFLLFISVLRAPAQSISPTIINVGGITSKTLDYSIGESASVAYFQITNQFSLSSGFIQSFTPLITGIVNRAFEAGEGLALFLTRLPIMFDSKEFCPNPVLANFILSTSKDVFLKHIHPFITLITSKRK